MKTETFEAHGHTWFKHTPGDPMPCPPESKIYINDAGWKVWKYTGQECDNEGWWDADYPNPIIGWRYADPQPEKPDELATLREENRLMKEAIKEASLALAYYASAIENDVPVLNMGVFTAETALTKLKPFLS